MASRMSHGHCGDAGGAGAGALEDTPRHVMTGGGEHYHSDPECVDKRSARYVGPAVCVERLETQSASALGEPRGDDLTPHPHNNSCRSTSTPYLSGRASSGSLVSRKSVRMPDDDDDDVTPRGLTYREEAPDTFTCRLSVGSASTGATARLERERREERRRENFQEWCRRKEQEKRAKQRAEQLRQPAAHAQSREEREECFRRWVEHKRELEERARAAELERRCREERALERARLQRERAKESQLDGWARRKEETLKAMKAREERRAARLASEEARRRRRGESAYRDWLRTSKNKPLPVPLNQGELSMRGSVSEMYINPVPWQ